MLLVLFLCAQGSNENFEAKFKDFFFLANPAQTPEIERLVNHTGDIRLAVDAASGRTCPAVDTKKSSSGHYRALTDSRLECISIRSV
jgi:hypothetical protein